MIYWKIYAGTFIYDSYQNPGEGLDLMSPHTFSFLFSYQKGWLLYTPLMIFAFMGLIWVRKKKREMLFPLVLFLLVNIWVHFKNYSKNQKYNYLLKIVKGEMLFIQ